VRYVSRIVVVSLVALAFVGVGRAQCQSGPYALLTTAGGNQVMLNLEVADTPEKQERGLMFREEMPEDNGMIFIFPGTTTIAFWMKDTVLPLSIAFVTDDLRIVDIQDMQPQTTDPHIPAAPYRYAIEVNQGYFARHGIAVGDTVQLVLGNP
jgi:uncharacterized membrane protein (UPF0127 family)